MAPLPKPALPDRVERLRQAYLAKLPATVVEARQGLGRLVADPTDDRALADLHRLFHNLKGTAASLGLPRISAEGAAGAETLKVLQGLAPSHRDMAGVLADLAGRIVGLERLGAEESGAADEPAQAQPALPAAARPAPDPQRRVVFLCDGDVDGERLGNQLACFGYSFNSFTDPEALRAALRDDPPDAVVMSTAGADIFEGGFSIPVLFVSERQDFDTRLKAVKAGGEAYFLKPVAAHEVVEVLDAVTVRHEPDPFRVLVVDDEPEMADYHVLILEGAGMVAHRLDDPAAILDELGEFQPDLVLMDMYMPTCSGRDLSRVIRQIPQFVSLPIIFLSSETDKTVQVSAMRVGADGFLTKPIQPEDLVTAVAVRAERTRVLRSLMMRDSLTSLLNHTTLSQFLETSIAAAGRNGGQLCFAMLDVDHFKTVNDSHGHPVGDQVLVALSHLLKQRLRSSDMVGRYGGEEFAAILQNVTEDEAVRIVDNIRRDFAALTFKAGGAEFSCSFSGGVAGFPAIDGVERIVQAADQALYAAKRGGRDRIIGHAAALAAELKEGA